MKVSLSRIEVGQISQSRCYTISLKSYNIYWL